MKTITLTLSTNDVAIIQRSLLYTAMALQNEYHNQQNSPEVRDKMFKAISDIFKDISNQCEKQEEQEDAE